MFSGKKNQKYENIEKQFSAVCRKTCEEVNESELRTATTRWSWQRLYTY